LIYSDVIDRIFTNTGSKGNRDATLVETTKKDIYDSIIKIYRKAEPIKKENPTTITITTVAQIATLPTDFFLPREVLFYATDGQRYDSRELEYEEYMRWNPDSEVLTTSFSELLTPVTPAELTYTKENFDYDGLVGYSFTDSDPQTLVWKPAINGTIKIYYSSFPADVELVLTESPAMHKVFHELIVLDVTIKQLVRKLGETIDQIKLFALQNSINYYKAERADMLKDFLVYVNTNTSTPIIEPFDFLNDPEMMLL